MMAQSSFGMTPLLGMFHHALRMLAQKHYANKRMSNFLLQLFRVDLPSVLSIMPFDYLRQILTADTQIFDELTRSKVVLCLLQNLACRRPLDRLDEFHGELVHFLFQVLPVSEQAVSLISAIFLSSVLQIKIGLALVVRRSYQTIAGIKRMATLRRSSDLFGALVCCICYNEPAECDPFLNAKFISCGVVIPPPSEDRWNMARSV